MDTNCLQFRWINASCYEFRLPDGRVITTDPYLDHGDTSFSAADMLTPDYVLITHTHFDHIVDLGTLMHRNDSAKLFVSDVTAAALADYYGIKFGQVYAVDNGTRIEVDGIGILPTKGKHSRFKNRDREDLKFMSAAPASECGVHGQEQLMLQGSFIYTDYVITLPRNIRMFFTGGDMTFSVPYEIAKNEAPLIVVRQVSNLDSPEQYADIVARLGGKIVLPHHQEHSEKRLGMPMAEFTARVNRRLGEIAPGMLMIDPKQYKWYELSLGIAEL